MHEPSPAGSPVDMERMRSWLADFAQYRVAVSDGRIERWLAQFAQPDRDLAARVLDVVEFVGNERVAGAFRAALEGLPGWHRDEERRIGRWYFVAFSGSSGESGDSMLYQFRTANRLGGKKFNHLFPHRSELLSLAPSEGDTVVLVDDFAGTGNQACEAWKEGYGELLPLAPNVYFVIVAASRSARDRIAAETDMVPVPHFVLLPGDDIFAEECRYFSDEEKAILLRYCRRASPSMPRGYGDCGLVIVFSHKCPNNSIPVLHARRSGAEKWEGLFRRHD